MLDDGQEEETGHEEDSEGHELELELGQELTLDELEGHELELDSEELTGHVDELDDELDGHEDSSLLLAIFPFFQTFQAFQRSVTDESAIPFFHSSKAYR